MPIYEYRCRKCGKQFEVLQGMTDPDVKTCKFCHGPAKRMVSLSSFHLKGSGWYVTDYGGKNQSHGGEKEKEAASAASGSEKNDAPAPAADAKKDSKAD